MRSSIRLWAIALGVWATASASAEAKDMSGRFGLGADTALGWNALGTTDAFSLDPAIPGVSLVYHVNESFGMQVLFGVGMFKQDEPDDKLVTWNTALRGIVNVSVSDEVSLGLVLGAGISGFRLNPEVGSHVSAIWVSVEAALRPEWFITDRFSLHTQVGVALAFVDDELSEVVPGSNDGAVGANLFANANLIGNAGFTFWF